MFGNNKKEEDVSMKHSSIKHSLKSSKPNLIGEKMSFDIPIKIGKRNFKNIFEELISVGFNNISFHPNIIEVHRTTDFEYDIKITEKNIVLKSKVKDKSQELNVLLSLIRIIAIISNYGDVNIHSVFDRLDAFLSQIHDFIDTSHLSLSAKYTQISDKYNILEKKYDDLVVSSEQTARLLLECERRRSEVEKELKVINKMTDKQLMYEVFKWIKLHNGNLNFDSFANTFNVPISRVEYAVDLLIKGGYIEKD